MKTTLKVGDTVKCVIEKALSSSGYGPDVKMGEKYTVKEIITTGKRKGTPDGHDHIDVGLKSQLGSISCFEAGDVIPRGSEIHWCHPSRFEKL